MQLITLSTGILAGTCIAKAIPAPAPTSAAVLPRIYPDQYFNYTTLTGFFAQDDPATNPSTFDYVSALRIKKSSYCTKSGDRPLPTLD
jgi:hypothetical protein